MEMMKAAINFLKKLILTLMWSVMKIIILPYKVVAGIIGIPRRFIKKERNYENIKEKTEAIPASSIDDEFDDATLEKKIRETEERLIDVTQKLYNEKRKNQALEDNTVVNALKVSLNFKCGQVYGWKETKDVNVSPAGLNIRNDDSEFFHRVQFFGPVKAKSLHEL